MRRLLLIYILLMLKFSNAQTIDESKYLFLLDLEVDTLCVNCAVSNCEALFLNAHRFKNLKKLTIQNLDCDLKYLSFFRKLRSLEIQQASYLIKKTKKRYTA